MRASIEPERFYRSPKAPPAARAPGGGRDCAGRKLRSLPCTPLFFILGSKALKP